MEVLAVIPARYESSRFEGKVVAKDTGKFLVQHTYERALCAKSVEKALIATDSELVMGACGSFGADCVMTSTAHKSGTDRIAEAVRDIDCKIVVNLQADEPEIEAANIDYLVRLLQDSDANMATLVADFTEKKQIHDPNIVKAIVDKNGRAVYFSRSVIPYDRGAGGVGNTGSYLRHLGIYAYRKDFLLKFTTLPQGKLEKCEKLEQLRAIEYGFTIITGKVEHAWEGIDTPEQYSEFVRRQKSENRGWDYGKE